MSNVGLLTVFVPFVDWLEHDQIPIANQGLWNHPRHDEVFSVSFGSIRQNDMLELIQLRDYWFNPNYIRVHPRYGFVFLRMWMLLSVL